MVEYLLSDWVRLELGVMPIKWFSTLPRSTDDILRISF